MSRRRFAPLLLATLFIVPTAAAQDGHLWVGPNVNMVSGTTFPDGDPFLQRQNEPSAAVSTRNPLHLLAGANDYRAVDIPGLPEGKETGDSWLGVFKSLDGGSTWRSYLLPGYPQDITPTGMASPLYLQGYDAGADPVVRAGTDGLFYYAGIAFIRENLAESAIFVARFEDLNNNEGGDPIVHHDTQIVATASGTLFVDKPWMAVDIPRGGAQCGNVYIAWAEIDSSGLSPTSNIMFSRSTDCGANWSTPIQLSANDTLPQGSTIAVAPDTGNVYVAWRQHTTLTSTVCVMGGGGFWKNAPESWPVEFITMGGVTYSKAEALDILNNPAGGDATIILAYQLIPAKLNYLSGTVSSAIQTVIDDADAWLVTNPLGSKPKGPAKTEGLVIRDVLEDYNNGEYLDGDEEVGFCEGTVTISDDAIVVVESTDDGVSFGLPVEVSEVYPFDQGTSNYSFRSNSYPTMTADEFGRVYLAWTTRGLATGTGDPDTVTGDARIVVSTSTDGLTWTTPQPIDQPGDPGHQIKPSLTYTGKLLLTYYDFREDVSGVFDRFVADFPSATPLPRHTVDVRAAAAEPGTAPVFTDYVSLLSSTQLSRYPFVITGTNEYDASPLQLQYNPPNLPMFKGGTVPFFSDYLDSATAPPFVWDEYQGAWIYNINPDDSPVAHAVWTDDRDVVGPPDGDWTSYVPPTHANSGGPSIFDPNQTVPVCNPQTTDVDRTRMRNQNIYTARLTEGLYVAVPGNSRPLGYFPGSSDLLQRAFVVYVQNTTDEERDFELSIPYQPSGGEASFEQFDFSNTAEVTIEPYSSASRTVFVTSTADQPPWPTIEIDVTENPALGPVPLQSTVRINADPYNPPPADASLADGEIYNPSIWNPSIWNPSIWNPSIWNPSIWNPSIWNTNLMNPSIWNPSIWNPAIVNPSIWNPSIWNPSIWNPSIWNPSIWNSPIANPSIWNPSIWNPSIWNASLTTATDVTWTVRNEGNATSAYSFNLLADQLPADQVFQLVVYKVYTTPVADGCELTEEGQQETLVNIVDPDFTSPDLLDPNSSDPDVASFYLEPGEEVFITLRVIDPDSSTGDVFYPEEVQVAVVAQGVNPEDALEGETQQPYAIPDISVPTTSSMDDGRSQHTSTLLPDGTILIAGGFNGTDGALATAEIYDPVARTFTPVSGGMNATHYFHTATLLDDGTVLLVGGSSAGPGTGAEIYDPDTDSFTSISDPNVMRSGHRATLLTDGRVLLTGGYDGSNTVASAEVYDPTTGLFTPVGSMGSARWEHSATLLTTGEVLVAGGADGIGTTDTVDLFDPTLNTFSPVLNTMSDQRRFHSGTLLPDGTVLLAGGYFDSSFVANTTTDIYDRTTNSLSPTGNLFFGRAAHSATLMADGTVLLAGGTSTVSGTLEIYSHIEAYNWNTGAFVEKGHLTIPRTEHTAERLPDGKVVITGGTTYGAPITEGTDTAELYLPAEKAKFKKIADLGTERIYHTATTLSGGDVIVVGGMDGEKNAIATIERFSPATGVITEVATMPTSRRHNSATLLDDGTVLIAGGSPDGGTTILNTALIYDPGDHSLTPTTGTLVTARYAHSATLLQDGRVLFAAGTGLAGALASTEIFDPSTGLFSPSDDLATARGSCGAVLLNDGRVLVAGGSNTDAFQLWGPATETFGPEGTMNETRGSGWPTLLDDGTVLIAGGRDDAFNWLDTAEVFDPVSDSFTPTAGNMRLPRGSQIHALLPSGEVLLAGGINTGGILLSYGEIYDPVTRTFRLTDVLTNHRHGTRATRLADGRVLIVGGQSFYGPGGPVPTSTVEIYNPWPEGSGSKALFLAPPMDVPVGQIVSPTIRVGVFDENFAPIAFRPVTLELEDYFGGNPITWVKNTDGNGIATFDDLWFDRVGPGRRIFAQALTLDGPLDTGLSAPFEVLPLVVTNTRDDGWGSLRRAIENAERNSGYTDLISFNIGGAGPHEIVLASELPLLNDSVLIDARTQPGYIDEPLIRLMGSAIPTPPFRNFGLQILADDSLVAGLIFKAFGGSGIRVAGASGVQILDNFVGIDSTGVDYNYESGILLEGSSGTEIIGNVVSGNGGAGIYLIDGSSGALISENYIGTDITGTTVGIIPGGNAGSGVSIRGSAATNNTVSDNLISGNVSGGIAIWEGASLNTVTGNLIGTDVEGELPIGNGYPGIWISEGSDNTIGGTGEDDGNIIAASAQYGIFVENTVGQTTIQGNLIGTNTSNPSMDPALGNGQRGIQLSNATDTTIGGVESTAGNVIVHSLGVGSGTGIGIANSSNTIVDGNLISANDGSGIVIQVSDNTQVYNNLIGTDAAGTGAMGNLRGMIITADCTGVTVGGPSGGNVISGNDRDGIMIATNGVPADDDTYVIDNNYIGTASDGVSPLPNLWAGILINPGSNQRIQNNTIAHNSGAGIEVRDVFGTSIGNSFFGNSIFSNGGLGIDLGGDGVTPNDSPGDGDTGPNALVNYPVLTEAYDNGTNTVVDGTLDAPVPGTNYTLRYFASDQCDPSDHGEGQTPVALPHVFTNIGPPGTVPLWTNNLPTGLAGKYVTATVSSESESNATSEFSNCVEVTSEIPLDQRNALIALYNSTGGPSWTNNTGWLGPPGTECWWYGITCGSPRVERIELPSNNLIGSLPDELADLPRLMYLDLSGNQLSGSIPIGLGNLDELRLIYLHDNQLTGEIPWNLGLPPGLEWLRLDNNQLTGNIPPLIGSPLDLTELKLQGNQLDGEVPTTLSALVNLDPLGGLDLRWNALHSTDSTLVSFLNTKQDGGDWQSTQTVAPTGISVGGSTSDSISLNWIPITYAGDTGGYQALYSTSLGGPYTPFATITGNKSVISMTVTGLDPGTTYYLVVRSLTYPHVFNPGTVVSENSAEVSMATLP